MFGYSVKVYLYIFLSFLIYLIFNYRFNILDFNVHVKKQDLFRECKILKNVKKNSNDHQIDNISLLNVLNRFAFWCFLSFFIIINFICLLLFPLFIYNEPTL